MEIDLKNIIEKIKQEGVGEAERTTAEMIGRAEKKSGDMIEAAEKEKAQIIKKAEQDAENLQKTGEEALRQASRDVMLGLREAIVSLFDSVVKKEIKDQLSPEAVSGMISGLVEKFEKDKMIDLEVLLSEKDKEALEKTFLAKLKEKLAKGVTLKASPRVESGFLIGEKGKESYYDFSDEAITEAFKAFLNPKITELLRAGGK
ncbi:MAG: hypothetical protein U9R44_04575 [Candidatus Omnitrophota bacterium]|nr:hypothetical protein [Candidatus Omnitrophota bacterium]